MQAALNPETLTPKYQGQITALKEEFCSDKDTFHLPRQYTNLHQKIALNQRNLIFYNIFYNPFTTLQFINT